MTPENPEPPEPTDPGNGPDPALLPKKFDQVADGVYRLRGDVKGGMNIYFVVGPDGEVVQFDAGTRFMTGNNRKVAEAFGGIDRIVLGHAHADHRGTAPRLGPPVYCHPDEVADAESKAAINSYMNTSELKYLRPRLLYPVLMRLWNGGPVKVAGTVEEGDDVAGFEVIHFPGHAPGQIGLWRESDRVALVSDTIYLVDSARLKPLPEGEASVPHPAWAWDHQQAKESVRKLASLKPETVLTGHDDPLEGSDLTATLLDAADRY
ncbi:MAG: MBL fold metallo-hydrolase [Thermoleophilia bacterium]|nr:MBL fold metallo-hydrolase [Thermoleophilia bacterium]